ncbi:SAM hydrolase/SAM-dependent halogenase family protein [Moellerella wisconsensis]|uniref:DNA-directed RNA polymerase subunit delta n=1 Tax=Moellerella wisconsensis ATCC 35017 TaxID=1354267 RepID=A0A0N0Z762_9GAMM|nr:S-adenosyl-l-methionine hydroxide adenosyltransferase family protein [Moellerella wisconsensis]KPD02277.1 hypothetical protein M992_2279 [Moellerella wisconsensis ATCC 35017]VFS53935.1 S-adenosyl-l-methionine hydroxide adenosyltransferase [Moellerella wisconsensis]
MKKRLLSLVILGWLSSFSSMANHALVLQSDFGLGDGAVSAMQGVAFTVDDKIQLFNLTHDIPEYDVWQAAYRLYQTAEYWPAGTVFVSVVDPGVGTERKSVVLKTKNNQYFVSPDNGTLTLVAEKFGIAEVREINEATNRLKNSNQSYTFHGRDVYAYVGAKLASGLMRFDDVGAKVSQEITSIPYQAAEITGEQQISGNISILDIRYGNVWTNIPADMLKKANINKHDKLCITIFEHKVIKYQGKAPFVSTFGDVNKGKPLVYINSLMNVSIALNMMNFAEKYQISSGSNWNINLKSCN